ncbi:alkaline phosphatase [Xylanibacillus composti]|uniref:Alkaline phosphatase n=1 Tax=Xylanibacillus composti TaxID=1572762 RepID=A0A8J4H955_9BACL|nr:choice-of-anchor I family protein [Xylanibacillus composti]MDT9726436.1 alkaline phosphatase [Xylanibacillus composti]GIQ71103.1 alkaline phosphatase [Xylanibacillus composti]
MRAWSKWAGILSLSLALTSLAPAVGAAAPAGTAELTLTKIGGYDTEAGLDNAGAEIVTYDPESQSVYLINGATRAIEIVDISGLQSGIPDQVLNVEDEQKISIVAYSPEDQPNLFGDVTSVVVHPTLDLIAAAVPNSTKTDNGSVVFFTKSGEYLGHQTVGALPDMITVTPDGTKFLVANEGEPNDDYTIDPHGSVSIIEIKGTDGALTFDVSTAVFTDESIVIDGNVRYASLLTGYVENPTHEQYAADFEPEYIVVTEDSKKAYVVLQESNAIAVLDLEKNAFTHVHGLGYKNYLQEGNTFDPSNRDGGIHLNHYPVLGTYMPDGMSLKTINGKTYLFTANEGDSRDYGKGKIDEIRFGDVDLTDGNVVKLDAAYYEGTTQAELDAWDVAALQAEDKLGRLYVMNTVSGAVYTDPATGVTYYNGLFMYGARSFSIWDVDKLGTKDQLVFDSKDDFERIIAQELPELFNTNHKENSFDNRSDDKGPEPEYVALGEVDGELYAFIGLERQSAIVVYNVTNPESPAYVTFVNMRDVEREGEGDLGPEGMHFIPAADSPTGKPLLLTGNEVSGTLAIFEIAVTDKLPHFEVDAVENEETYTISENNGIVALTVNSGVSGWTTFAANVTAVLGHDGMETVVFKHSHNGEQLGISAIRGDFDSAPLAASAQFNVRAGDVVEVYIVDALTTDPEQQPIVLQ